MTCTQVDRYAHVHTLSMVFSDGSHEVHLCSCSAMDGAWKILDGLDTTAESYISVLVQLDPCIHSQAVSSLRTEPHLGAHWDAGHGDACTSVVHVSRRFIPCCGAADLHPAKGSRIAALVPQQVDPPVVVFPVQQQPGQERLVLSAAFGSSREHTVITTHNQHYRCSRCSHERFRCSHVKRLVKYVEEEVDAVGSVFEPFTMRSTVQEPQPEASTSEPKAVSTKPIPLDVFNEAMATRADYTGEQLPQLQPVFALALPTAPSPTPSARHVHATSQTCFMVYRRRVEAQLHLLHSQRRAEVPPLCAATAVALCDCLQMQLRLAMVI
jgi:hypothetical protein